MKRVTVAVAIFLILAAGTALAVTPVGQWDYKGYNWPNLIAVGSTQGICFLAGGKWYSTTFAGWNGEWRQDSDRIRFYGTTSVASTAEFGQFISNKRISGEFAHFVTKPTVQQKSIGNFSMNWKSETCDPAPASSGYFAEDGDPAIE